MLARMPISVCSRVAFLLLCISSIAKSQFTNAEGRFTHMIRLPANVDVTTIRFERIRVVKVPATIDYPIDPAECQELVTGGLWRATGCTYNTIRTKIAAVEITYSFGAPPLASDEFANRSFRFSVYFRPEELPANLQEVLSRTKLTRAEAAPFFTVNIHRNSVNGMQIDRVRSRFCRESFVDGAWTPTDPSCKDKISWARVSMPSDEITVIIEPRPFVQPTAKVQSYRN